MKIKKKVTRFLKDGNAFEVFLCVIVACIALVSFYIFINFLFPKGENYLKLAVAGIFSLGGLFVSTIFAHKEKNREAVLKYVTEKRLGWIDDTRKVTADLCAEVMRCVDIIPNLKKYQYNVSNIEIEITDLFIELYDITNDDIESFIKQLNLKTRNYPSESSIMKEIDKRLSECKTQDFYYAFSSKFISLYLKYNLKGERDRIILQILRELYIAVENLNGKFSEIKFKELSYKNISELYDNKKAIITILFLLVQHTQVYLKLEWERIKNESIYDGSVKHRRKKIKRKMEKDRLELYKEQLDFDVEGRENKKKRLTISIWFNIYTLYIEAVYNRFRKQFLRRWLK